MEVPVCINIDLQVDDVALAPSVLAEALHAMSVELSDTQSVPEAFTSVDAWVDWPYDSMDPLFR